MKPFLRLRGGDHGHYTSTPICSCCILGDEPMKIKFMIRDGIIKAWIQRTVDGVQEWWPYSTEMRFVSLPLRPY
jgi:hypothetical protein